MRLVRVNARLRVRQILGLSDSPRSIALATAVGMAIAFSPTYGFQILLAIAAAMLLRCNKVATVLPVLITNPVTAPPIIFFQYLLGRTILGGGSHRDLENAGRLAQALGEVTPTDLWASLGKAVDAVRNLGWGVLGPTLLGMLISSVILGLLTYPVVYRGVIWFRRRRAERVELRRRKAAGPTGLAGQPLVAGPTDDVHGKTTAPSPLLAPEPPKAEQPAPPPTASVGTGASGKT